MTKYGQTKAKIVELVDQGVDNLSDLCRMLDLAPSTVSKHLEELESAGIIRLKQEGYAKKWKHYELVKSVHSHGGMYNPEGASYRDRMVLDRLRNRLILPASAIAIIALLIYFFGGIAYGNSLLSIPISITDPPHVPPGTQALYINYSSFALLVNNSGLQKWTPINSSGRINLMSIINVSDIIATLSISPHDTIDAVKFNISSASITIDNVTYPVEIANDTVYAHIDDSHKLNPSSALLVDISPTVVPMHINGSYRFALLPFLSAAFWINKGYGMAVEPELHAPIESQPAGGKYPIINNPFYRQMNLSINAPIVVSGANSTSFSMNIRNTGDAGIRVYGVILEEDNIGQNSSGMWARAFNETNSSININTSALYANGYWMPSKYRWTERIMLRHPANIIVIYGTIPGAVPLGAFMRWRMPKCTEFSAESNGTLEEVASPFYIYNKVLASTGYLLQPFSNKTFVYKGESLGHFGNAPYEVLILTDDGVASGSFNGNYESTGNGK